MTDPDAKPAKKPKKMFKGCSCVLDAWNSNPNVTFSRDSIINDFLKDWDYPTGNNKDENFGRALKMPNQNQKSYSTKVTMETPPPRPEGAPAVLKGEITG